MKLIWLGHACFKIESDGCTMIFDPFEDQSVPGLKSIREYANKVFCSHEHYDHNARSNVILHELSTFPYQVSEIDTYHDNKRGTLRGKNTIYILNDGNFRIAHFGDLGCELEKEQIEQLKDLDVAMIPVGGYYTINALQAKEIVNQIQPKIMIPMHYHSDNFGFDVLGSLEDYLRLCDDVIIYHSNELEITKDMKKQTAVLKYC